MVRGAWGSHARKNGDDGREALVEGSHDARAPRGAPPWAADAGRNMRAALVRAGGSDGRTPSPHHPASRQAEAASGWVAEERALAGDGRHPPDWREATWRDGGAEEAAAALALRAAEAEVAEAERARAAAYARAAAARTHAEATGAAARGPDPWVRTWVDEVRSVRRTRSSCAARARLEVRRACHAFVCSHPLPPCEATGSSAAARGRTCGEYEDR